MPLTQLYNEYKSLLFSIAYRMVGTIADAEDIVQDVFVRLSQLDIASIDHIKGYLVKMTTNRCINLIQSNERTREVYPGPWLPEPFSNGTSSAKQEIQDVSVSLEKWEQVQYALLATLQTLNAQERAVFILRETFSYSYREIADIIGKSESNCRKICSRSRLKMKKSCPNLTSAPVSKTESNKRYIEAFICALQYGDMEPLIEKLLDDIVLITDGGGKVRAAYNPIIGIERVRAFLTGVRHKGSFDGDFSLIELNGEWAILLKQNDQPKMIFLFHIDQKDKGLRRIFILLNPDKLSV
ncbi:sigma-70 family RNA polymerase sigma factor [Bacillus sp. JCM 19034]|uniref:sigma-70 family RNA polymerase sigma factor n=1 Tax=Bacillus sp. JCM 19034 TaxID=1481928 RepID=UPI000783DBEF|nr:sigma-70 family RNA polymerase sigma factor [Bacillus sp. JCM 19034]